MASILILIVIAVLSLLVSRVASVALMSTGLARSSARFQSRSALTGVGFTTSESEAIVNHPVRRRVVMALMLVGNVGLVTAVGTLLTGFIRVDAEGAAVRSTVLVTGLCLVYWVSRSATVDRRLGQLVSKLLRRYTDLDVRDYAALLHVAGAYGVKELYVRDGDWLAGRTLGELRLGDEGVVVLGIVRADGRYLGAPGKETPVRIGDQLILYGHGDTLADIDERSRDDAGDSAHERASAEHRRRNQEEESAPW